MAKGKFSALGLYTLMGKLPIPCDNVRTWSKWFEKRDDRRVARDEVGPLIISTVFLSIDHGFGFSEHPLLFETMIFGLEEDTYQERCETWDEAEAMHKKAVEVATILVDAAHVSLEAFKRLFEERKQMPKKTIREEEVEDGFIDDVSWDDWKDALRGYIRDSKVEGISDDPDFYREYYDDGYKPADALIEVEKDVQRLQRKARENEG